LSQGTSASGIQILKDSENKLLSRRELTVLFPGGNGFVTRQSAIEAVSSKLGVPKDRLSVLYLNGEFGKRDLLARVFVYSNANLIGRQLPKYLKIRDLPKEERKKAREAMKAKPGAPAEQQHQQQQQKQAAKK
jgi:ribosomal protein S24E